MAVARPDPNVPIEESVGAMGEMVAAGKVRAIGVSEVTIAQLDAAHRTHPLAGVQYELSPWSRGVLDVVQPWCVARLVTLVHTRRSAVALVSASTTRCSSSPDTATPWTASAIRTPKGGGARSRRVCMGV